MRPVHFVKWPLLQAMKTRHPLVHLSDHILPVGSMKGSLGTHSIVLFPDHIFLCSANSSSRVLGGAEGRGSWKEIEYTFGKHLAGLKAVQFTSDVKVTSW